MIIDLLLGIVRNLFLDPLAALLPVYAPTGGVGMTAWMHDMANTVNAMIPIYMPLWVIATVIQVGIAVLPIALGLWLWSVAKP